MRHKYNLLALDPPVMPKRLPKFIKLAIEPIPEVMKPAAANAIFAPMAALMSNVFFTYPDGVEHEPTIMEGVVSASGQGKGYLDPLLETIIRCLREHDEESRRKMEEYSIAFRKTSNNKEKPERPKDAAILVPEPDMTNPAFIQLLMDAEREGNKSLYCIIPEVDLMNATCGGHNKITNVMRLNFDTKHYGAQRATTEGVSGNPRLRWRFNFATTVGRAQKFFKDGLDDGTLGRINITYIPKQRGPRSGFPKQGRYDEKFRMSLEPYLERLRGAQGEITVPSINRLMEQLRLQMAEITDLSADDVFQSLYYRSLVISWLKGCMLYVAENYRWSKEIGEFVEWSVYYDLWSKIILFAPQWSNCNEKTTVDPRKYGPANMLDMMPVTFTRDQLENKRESLNKPKDAKSQLWVWQDRGYITYDEANGCYTKTADYLANHPQQNV